MTAIMGMETEWALAGTGGGERLSPAKLCSRLMARARELLDYLAHNRLGIFLTSGARYYNDHGNHPEWCTAECTNPTDVVNQVRAGERILGNLLQDLPGAALYRCNVDYVRGSTWGSHESHLHRKEPKDFPRLLIPHLVSRIIYTGAGGLNPHHAGLAFSLSPRATKFRNITSPSRVISIYDTRDESLAGDKYRRCHIILGESLCTDLPLWLRLATTSIIVTLADEGLLRPEHIPQLSDPIRALHGFAGDLNFCETAQTEEGWVTALDIQYAYLRVAERHLGHDALSEWAPEACLLWRNMLNRLAQGPAAVACTCDWAIKYAIFTHWLEKYGFSWEHVSHLNSLLKMLRRKARNLGSKSAEICLLSSKTNEWRVEKILETIAPARQIISADRDELIQFLKLRRQLCEIDLRFGRLPGGLFATLEPELDHAAPGVTPQSITRAETTPPQNTRAAARGRAIKRLHGSPERYSVDWMGVKDLEKNRILDLSDPFNADPRWKNISSARTGSLSRLFDAPGALSIISRAYNEGDFNKVLSLLSVLQPGWERQEVTAILYLPYLAWVNCRIGHNAIARTALRRLCEHDPGRNMITDYAAVYRFKGLCPDFDRLWDWIERGDEYDLALWDPSNHLSFLGHKGYVLSRYGKFARAEEALRQSLSISVDLANHGRIIARNRCDLADLLRILGQREEAERELAEADHFLRDHRFAGERAGSALLLAAKLAPDREEARAILDRARRILQQLGHSNSLTRAHLLKARLCEDRTEADLYLSEVRDLQRQSLDLQSCPRLRMIIDHWDEWACGAGGDMCGDYFWLL